MRNRFTDELAVCGFNAVMAAAEHNPQNINRLFLREDRLKAFSGVCKQLAERKRPYKLCEDEELERVCKTTHHQGVVAMIYAPEIVPLSREELDEWAQNGTTGIVLHSVENDHNLGAIARSAAFFDAPLIVLSGAEAEERLTTSAYRVAEGGMEHVKIRTIDNTALFLKDASRLLLTIGTENRARQRIRDLSGIIGDYGAKLGSGKNGPGIALVLGNEENGLPDDVKDACSVMVRIPGTGLMESLNVAQAATLFLHELWNR